MKKLPLMVAILLLVFSGLLFFWWKVSFQPVKKSGEPQDFLILKGMSATQVANKLSEEGLIKNSLAFKFYVQLTGKSKKIQSGEYSLNPSESLLEIVDSLLKGPTSVWVTIPEGLRKEEVAEKFIVGLNKEGEDADNFRKTFLNLTKEGYVFPDTYLLPKSISAEKTVALIENTFEKRMGSIEDDISNSNLSLSEIINIASMLERETITDEEKPVVAGILIKRWEADWPLQVDATVQYAKASIECARSLGDCEWWPRPLTKDDLSINSAYNTYKYSGLSPTPISNPGIKSISAAANPEESDYWFYIHDTKGNIHYARSLEEHNFNVSKYLGK